MYARQKLMPLIEKEELENNPWVKIIRLFPTRRERALLNNVNNIKS